MLAKSGNSRCPAREGTEGQSRTKQREISGVRNEQVPAAKAKVCSELHRNMQRRAEMSRPLVVQVPQVVTTCKGLRLPLGYWVRSALVPFDSTVQTLSSIRSVRRVRCGSLIAGILSSFSIPKDGLRSWGHSSWLTKILEAGASTSQCVSFALARVFKVFSPA